MTSWITSSALDGIPGVPKCGGSRDRWLVRMNIQRRQRSIGKGWEFLVSSFPPEIQSHLAPSALQGNGDHHSSANNHSFIEPYGHVQPHEPSIRPAHANHDHSHLRLAPPPPPKEPAAIPLKQPPAHAVSASVAEVLPAVDHSLYMDADLAALEIALAEAKPRPLPRTLGAPRRVSAVDSADLWSWAESQTSERRAEGAERAQWVAEVVDLIVAESLTRDEALARVGAAAGIPAKTLCGWYTVARRHARTDWPAALIPRARGRIAGHAMVEMSPAAWDWFFNQYMTRGQPTVAEIYRRLVEIAPQHGWTVPSERTVNRRVDAIPRATRVYYREGKDALKKLIPWQRRDYTVYGPGEAVNGDGLKFDRLWVKWPDGEVLNTSTGWFWQDVRTARLLAYRLSKTENTDLFRLATYDLLGVCLPRVAWMDNTTVAANLAMTGGADGRHRFGHERRAEDPLGMLMQLGIEPHFTDPNQESASPGSKRIERSFGIGGLHTEVAHSPRLCGHGFSKADPIDYDLFAAIVAEEVQRSNARAKRRTAECAGVKSFDDLWRELTAAQPLRVAASSQRRLLLLMVEKCHVAKTSGEIQLKAGSSHLGKARFWADWLPEYGGKDVAVYFDPADLTQPVTVYDLSGLKLGEAQRLPDAGHNDTDAAREVRKARKRQQKAWKKQAQDEARISALVAAEQYPASAPTEIPAPGVVSAKFGGGRRVLPDGTLVDLDTGEIASEAPTMDAAEAEARFAANVASLAAARSRAAAV